MESIRQKAVRVNLVTETLNALSNQRFEVLAVRISAENFLSVLAMQHHVVERAWYMNSGFSGHGMSLWDFDR